uniref:G_PROTEIN_RECEP_F1_2 domain-containing protein n=1 Tax=Macrostomum lignano TaxID=282301 RepID=A0A1I8FRB4_9PLAT
CSALPSKCAFPGRPAASPVRSPAETKWQPASTAEEQLSPSTRYGSGLAARETGLNSRSRISSSDMTDAGGGASLLEDLVDTSPVPSTAAPANAAKDPLHLTAYTVMAAIMAVGLAGNLIVLLVYARKKDGHAANVFILSLAVSDLIACCLVIPMSIAMEVNDYMSSALACKLYYLLNCSGIPFSSMLMAAIAVERYFCICRPFLRAITVPRAKAIVLSLGAVAFSLGLAIAVFCSVVVRRVDGDIGNGTETAALEFADYGECREISELKRSLANESAATASRITISDASLVFFNIFQKLHLSLFGVCIALVFALYVRIYLSVLRLRRKKRERQQNRQQLERLGTVANNGGGGDAGAEEPRPSGGRAQSRRKSLRLVDSDALQNLKTAAMLF